MRTTVLALVCAIALAACGGDSSADTDTTTTTLAPVSTLPPDTSSTAAPPPTTTTTQAQPPALLVEATPAAETGYLVTIAGTTDPDAIVTIDGEEVPTDDGVFVVEALSSPGANEYAVVATDTDGLASTEVVSWTWDRPDGWAAALGDSVMLGSQAEIEKRLGEDIVDATVSRQFLAAPDLVEDLLARSVPPELIVIGLGTNGPVQDRHFDAVMEIAADVPLVAFVNVRVPRAWESTSNTALAEGVERYENAVLVDWWTPTHDRDDLFAKDGFHPKQTGRVIMGELIASTVFSEWEPLEE